MTKKGKDYKNGGGFVTKNNKIVNYEDIAKIGEKIIYNSKTNHGVLDMIQIYFTNRSSKNGRYVGLTTCLNGN